MEYRLLGNSGLKVSVLSLGSWINFDKEDSFDHNFQIINSAILAGINFIDNAELYGHGSSEVAIGKILKHGNWPRSGLIITTKLYFGGDGPNENGLSRKHVIEGMRASLKRLQLDYVDVVFAHRPDDLTPMEEIVRAFNWCIDQGLTFYWGVSEWSAEQIMDAHRVAEKLNLVGPIVEQPQYNMFHRHRVESEYAPLYRKLNLGTTVFSPLAHGILTGKYVNGIPPGSRLAGESEDGVVQRIAAMCQSPGGQEKNVKVAKLMKIADSLGCSMAQLALAWCLVNPNVSSVIIGVSKLEQLSENLEAVKIYKRIDQAIMDQIDSILDNKPPVVPLRY